MLTGRKTGRGAAKWQVSAIFAFHRVPFVPRPSTRFSLRRYSAPCLRPGVTLRSGQWSTPRRTSFRTSGWCRSGAGWFESWHAFATVAARDCCKNGFKARSGKSSGNRSDQLLPPRTSPYNRLRTRLRRDRVCCRAAGPYRILLKRSVDLDHCSGRPDDAQPILTAPESPLTMNRADAWRLGRV